MIQCPRCKSVGDYIVLREYWRGSFIEFEQKNDGTLDHDEMSNRIEGNPFKVEASCLNCGKPWKLRGVHQISQLKGWSQ